MTARGIHVKKNAKKRDFIITYYESSTSFIQNLF